MSFTINGLDPQEFEPLFGLADSELAARGIAVKIADAKPGYPCRITLEDAEPGERVLLLNFESHKTDTPYRSCYAIYVRENTKTAASYTNELPPVFRNRPMALRIFDAGGNLIGADMGVNSELESKIKAALATSGAAYIHAHNAMHGCFAAEIRPATA